MKKTLLLFAITLLAAISINAQDISLDEILKSHFEAIGQDKLTAVKSMKMTGKVSTQGMEFPVVMRVKRPGKVRMEATIQGSVMIQAYNGTEGYMIIPMSGSTEPQDFNEDQLKQFKETADMDGKLYNYKEKGSTLELVGAEDMEGTEVYKLKLTEKPDQEGGEGDVTYLFIDADSFVILKTNMKRSYGGNEVEMDQFTSNYKMMNGVAIAHSIESKVGGNSMSQITIDEIVFDEEMPDNLFDKPAKEEGK